MGTYKHNNAEHKVSWLSFMASCYRIGYPFEPLIFVSVCFQRVLMLNAVKGKYDFFYLLCCAMRWNNIMVFPEQ